MSSLKYTSRQTYQYGDKKIDYTLVKSKRRKTSEIIIDKDEITIRAPYKKSIPEVDDPWRQNKMDNKKTKRI